MRIIHGRRGRREARREAHNFVAVYSRSAVQQSLLSLFLLQTDKNLIQESRLVDGFWDRSQGGGRGEVRESLLDHANEILRDMDIDGFSNKADEGRH